MRPLQSVEFYTSRKAGPEEGSTERTRKLGHQILINLRVPLKFFVRQ